MKLLILSTSDSQGGAAIATYRIHSALRLRNIDSHMLTQSKKTDDYSVIGQLTPWQKLSALLRPCLDSIVTRLYPNRNKQLFSPSWLPERLAYKVAKLKPEIVHLFWVNHGFLKIETLKKIKKPIVWTMHDMWPITGGCHYNEECGRFQDSCGACPLLHSERECDLSRRIWNRKKTSWESLPIVVVATSYWLANMARASSLFKDKRIEVIPNAIDTDKYKPINKKVARAAFNLPLDKRLILFSAFSATTDKRKGNQFLLPALEKISQEGWGVKTELVVIGASRPESQPDIGMTIHYMGRFNDEISQVLLYSAADVVVAPSMQENLSNTVMESLACGTPVVAFNIGGMPDMIVHNMNGYLAVPFESNDLAKGITWVLENDSRHNFLSKHARQLAVDRYALKVVADRYTALYESVLQ